MTDQSNDNEEYDELVKQQWELIEARHTPETCHAVIQVMTLIKALPIEADDSIEIQLLILEALAERAS